MDKCQVYALNVKFNWVACIFDICPYMKVIFI